MVTDATNQTPVAADRWERWIERMDRPLLVLALATMVPYLLELRGYDIPWLEALTLLIDLLFVFDLGLKLRVYGRSYVETPWFLIDLISCLPLIDGLANGFGSLRAIRFVRGLRILRILRGLRILRALRSIPAFEELVKDATGTQSARRLRHLMNVGLIGMTLAVLVSILVVRTELERAHIRKIDAEIKVPLSHAMLRTLGGSIRPPRGNNSIPRVATVDGVVREVYFDLRRVDEQSDMIEFFVIVGMMLAMLFLMYIMAYHQLDVTQNHLRALLNLALAKQVAERIIADPTAYARKSRMPATIMFMDFVGFTHTSERLAGDLERLSEHLEGAMDRLVGELVRHDMIIDKFIGDAIMSFRGGPLVEGRPDEHAYRAVRSALACTRALEALNDPFFHRVKIGGASGDDCLIGAFGTSTRLSYTILGDTVNLAARLEPASGQCGTRNLFCEQTYLHCAQRPDLVWRRWGRIRVAGKSAPIHVYEAFDADDLGDALFVTTFHRARDDFERGAFEHARELFLVADSQRPGGDPPSQTYAHWCEKLLLGGPPVGWEPVFEAHK